MKTTVRILVFVSYFLYFFCSYGMSDNAEKIKYFRTHVTYLNFILGPLLLKDLHAIVAHYLDCKAVDYRCTTTFEDHNNSIIGLCQLQDARLAFYGTDGYIKIWDLKNSSSQTSFVVSDYRNLVVGLYQRATGLLVARLSDGTIKTIETNAHVNDSVNNNRIISPVYSVCQLQNELIALASNHVIKIVDTLQNEYIMDLRGQTGSIKALCGLSGAKLASGSSDGTIALWDLASNNRLATFHDHATAVYALEKLNDSQLISGAGGGIIKIWDLKADVCISTMHAHKSSVYALCSLDNNKFVSAAADGSIKIWDGTTRKKLAEFDGHRMAVRAIRKLNDGRLASCSDDGDDKNMVNAISRLAPARTRLFI